MPVLYLGSISCPTVPQPWLGRGWNSPTESLSTSMPSCGYRNDCGTAELATLCSPLSCSAVAMATTAACRGSPRWRATSTLVAALRVCAWLSPATGAGGRLGGGGTGDADADGDCDGTGRAMSRDASSGAL